MSSLPVWLWGLLGGLALGPMGLLILWGGCARGPLSLLKRFAISMVVKLTLAFLGFWLAVKQLHFPVEPLIYGFFGGYFLSLIMEISVCLWKVRRSAQNAAAAS